jgi:hypothetical protein
VRYLSRLRLFDMGGGYASEIREDFWGSEIDRVGSGLVM